MIQEPLITTKKSKPPYLLGLLGIIPLVGAFVGLALVVLGLFQYKDKKLTIIGAACIAWTIIVYSLLGYAGKNAPIFRKGFEDISQMQLNSLIKSIEYYKLIHGQYPDNLPQLLEDDKLTTIVDPAQGMNMKGTVYFNYENMGEQYSLFSSGQDGKPNTADDLYPEVPAVSKGKIGLIEHR